MDVTPHPLPFVLALVVLSALTLFVLRRPMANSRLHPYVYAALLLAVGGLAVMNLYTIRHPSRDHLVNSDLRIYYSAAKIGLTQGWSHLYDAALQRHVIEGITGGSQFLPFVSPPELAWLSAPLTLFRYPVVYKLMVPVALASLGAAAVLMPARTPFARFGYVASIFAAWPAITAAVFVNFAVVFPLIIVVSWRLLRADRQVAAGLVFALAALKPHVLLAVPFALLLAGYRRFFISWAVAAVALAVVAIASLGVHGMQQYLDLLRLASSYSGQTRDAAFYWFGAGLVAWLFAAAVLALVAFIALTNRRDSLETVMSAAIIGSLLLNHYLNGDDWAAMVPALWLGLIARPQYALAFAVAALGLIGYLHYRPMAFIPAFLVLVALARPEPAPVAVTDREAPSAQRVTARAVPSG